MTFAAQTHYEVHVYDGRSWAIAQAMEDQDAAKHIGKTMFGMGKYKAVKVTKERYNKKDGTFTAMTIATFGHVQQVKRMAEKDDPLKRIQLCRKPTDLYNYEGRRSIRLQLGTTLDHWSITPTELLHDPSYYLKLDNAGTLLQNAIQRTAVKQIQGTEISVQERMRELYEVIGKAYTDLKQLLDNKSVPNLKKTHLAKAAEALKNEHQRSTLLSAGITSLLADEKDIWSKFSLVLTLLSPGLPSWVVGIIDYLFAEMMQTPAILKGIMQAQENDSELDRMIGLVQLRHGKAAVKGFEVFNRFIVEGNLPHTQTALQQLLLQQMQHGGPLSQGDLADQLDAIGAVKNACEDDLAQSDKFSKDIFSAITSRCEKALSSHSINVYMSETNGPIERAKRLLKLAPKIFGKRALKQLADQIEPIIVPAEQQTLILKGVENPLEAMASLRQLQLLVNKGNFEESSHETFNKALDSMCLSLMRSTNLIKKIMTSDIEQWQKAMKLLNLLSKATFVEGDSASSVRSVTRDLMRGSNLLDELMKSAKSQQEQVIQLKSFMDLLQSAGMGGGGNEAAKNVA